MGRKVTLKTFSKHIKVEINAVDTGTNLSKDSNINLCWLSYVALVFESLRNLSHLKTPVHYLNALPLSASTVVF